MSAWDEDEDDKVWGSLHWPLSETLLEKELRRPPRKLDRRQILELLDTMEHIKLNDDNDGLKDAEEVDDDDDEQNDYSDLDI